MSIYILMSYKSICSYCRTVVTTKTDQSKNLRFVCSKSCNQKHITPFSLKNGTPKY